MRPLRVAIIGGSLGGLHAGLRLREIGCDVQIYERSPAAMTSRGAGIVVQEDTIRYLEDQGIRGRETFSTTSECRVFLDREGNVEREMRMFQRFTAWNTLYGIYRHLFPQALYHNNMRFADLSDEGESIVAYFDGGREVACDLLLCADGAHSTARRLLLPDVKPAYAGYVAVRGLVPERDLPPSLVQAFENRFTFFYYPGSHVFGNVVPGPDGQLEEGERRLNWTWYVRAAEGEELDRFLTDREGRRRDASVPPGWMPDPLLVALRARAARELPPTFAEAIAATPEPFVQPILDVAAPRMAFGRVALLGDAAFIARPHTAAGAAKAFADGDALSQELAESGLDVPGALQRWEGPRLEFGRYLVRLGRMLGERMVSE